MNGICFKETSFCLLNGGRELFNRGNERETCMGGTKPAAGAGGNIYVPYPERKGNESIVYFTGDLSVAGLIKMYEKVNGNIRGKTGVKVRTGEPHGRTSSRVPRSRL